MFRHEGSCQRPRSNRPTVINAGISHNRLAVVSAAGPRKLSCAAQAQEDQAHGNLEDPLEPGHEDRRAEPGARRVIGAPASSAGPSTLSS